MGNLKDYVTNTAGDLVSFGAKGLINYGLNSMAMKKQNEYNLPKNQMARFVDAGLSPAAAAQAILGNPSTSAAMTGQGGADQKMSYMEMKIQKKQLEMQERYNEAEIDVLASQAEKNRAEASRTNMLTPYEVQQIQQNVKESISRVNLNDKQKEQVEAMTNKIILMTQVERDTALAALQKLRYENDVAKVKSELAKTYHIDVDSDFGSMLVQLLLSGDKSVIDTIIKSFKEVMQVPDDASDFSLFGGKPTLNDYLYDKYGYPSDPIERHHRWDKKFEKYGNKKNET